MACSKALALANRILSLNFFYWRKSIDVLPGETIILATEKIGHINVLIGQRFSRHDIVFGKVNSLLSSGF